MKKKFFAVLSLVLLLFISGCTTDPVPLPQLEDVTYQETQTLKDITLPNGYEWEDETIVPTVDVEFYHAIYKTEVKQEFINIKLHVLPALPEVEILPSAETKTLKQGDQLPEIIPGKAKTSGTFSWVNPSQTLVFGENLVDWKFVPNSNNYKELTGKVSLFIGRNVKFEVTPLDASVVVTKDEEVISPVKGIYYLEENLKYTYTVSKKGYYSVTEEVPLEGGIISVSLEKEPEIVGERRNAISEINSYLDKSLYLEEQVLEIENIIKVATEKINTILTKEELNSYVKEVKASLDSIFTKEEVKVAEPKVRISLQSGETYSSRDLVFEVYVQDQTGKKLSASQVSVENNSVPASLIWDDTQKTSYQIRLEDYENELVITVKNGPITKTFTYNFYFIEKPANITISVDAFTIGAGYLVEPQNITIDDDYLAKMAEHFKFATVEEFKDKLNAAYLVTYILETNNYGVDNTGRLDQGFYLSYILGFKHENKIPANLLAKLEEHGIKVDTPFSYEDLGEFDYTPNSGWMYSVNNVILNVGLAQYKIKDGDVIRVQFTLAIGSDISEDFEGNNWFEPVSKDELTKAIAYALNQNVVNNKEFENALALIQQFGITQQELDSATEALIKRVELEPTLIETRTNLYNNLLTKYNQDLYLEKEAAQVNELLEEIKTHLNLLQTVNELNEYVESKEAELAKIWTKVQIEKGTPIISFDITSGTEVDQNELGIVVNVVNKFGEPIENLQVKFKNNNRVISLKEQVKDNYTYNLKLTTYENKISFEVVNGPITVKEEIVIYLKLNPYTVTVSIEAFTIGMGYIVKPTIIKVDDEFYQELANINNVDIKEIKASFNPAYIVQYLLTKNNLSYKNTGTLQQNFYLSSIKGLNNSWNAPVEILAKLEENSIDYNTTPKDPTSLGEFDYVSGAGWMYTVGNVLPNVGFAGYKLQDNDVMRIQFSLAYGSDISAGWGGQWFPEVDKDKLTNAIAVAINGGLGSEPVVQEAMEVAYTFGVRQETVDEMVSNVLAYVNHEKLLEQARIDAENEIKSYVKPTDYAGKNKKAVQNEVKNAVNFIKTCNDIDQIWETVKQAKAQIDTYETKAQETARKLVTQKENALISLNNYMDRTKYEVEELRIMEDILNTASTYINEAKDKDEVTNLLNSFKADLDGLKTINEKHLHQITTNFYNYKEFQYINNELQILVTYPDETRVKSNEVIVLVNEVELKMQNENDKGIIFVPTFIPGENTIRIIVETKEGMDEYNFVVKYVEKPIEVYYSFDAFSLGLGYFIEPTKITLDEKYMEEMQYFFGLPSLSEMYEKVNSAYIFVFELEHHGFQAVFDGDFNNAFYLKQVVGVNHETIMIPDELRYELEQKNIRINDTINDPKALGEFDHSSQSGWMYEVNNVFPDVGFADYMFKDGDIMRVQFTLATGADLGDTWQGNNIFPLVNKFPLTKALADAKEAGLQDTPEYDEAMHFIQRFNFPQERLDYLTNALLYLLEQGSDLIIAKNDARDYLSNYKYVGDYSGKQLQEYNETLRNALSEINQAQSKEDVDGIVDFYSHELDRIPTIKDVEAMMPVISLNVTDNQEFSEPKVRLELTLFDSINNPLNSKNVIVKLNDQVITKVEENKGLIIYELVLQEKDNILSIHATNIAAEKDQTLTLVLLPQPEVPFITVSVEAFTIGNSYVVLPQKLYLTDEVLTKMNQTFNYASNEELLAKLNVAHVAIYVLESAGYTFESAGNPNENFSLQVINGFNHSNKIPRELLARMEENSVGYQNPLDYTRLGELDYSKESKWLATVNDVLVTNMSKQHVKENDVVRIQFSLCNGYDISRVEGRTYVELANKDSLTKTIAEAVECGLTETPEFKQAVEACGKINTFSNDLAKAEKALRQIIK